VSSIVSQKATWLKASAINCASPVPSKHRRSGRWRGKLKVEGDFQIFLHQPLFDPKYGAATDIQGEGLLSIGVTGLALTASRSSTELGPPDSAWLVPCSRIPSFRESLAAP